ncbi:MAG: hypothetical protein H6908_05685 [Hyphomicrobiales bacterium]|nr:hypothetical protein [Rickettsiales bacterium]MCP5362105.1 hypothetical protein [Hyphomicrobiales bacterium]
MANQPEGLWERDSDPDTLVKEATKVRHHSHDTVSKLTNVCHFWQAQNTPIIFKTTVVEGQKARITGKGNLEAKHSIDYERIHALYNLLVAHTNFGDLFKKTAIQFKSEGKYSAVPGLGFRKPELPFLAAVESGQLSDDKMYEALYTLAHLVIEKRLGKITTAQAPNIEDIKREAKLQTLGALLTLFSADFKTADIPKIHTVLTTTHFIDPNTTAELFVGAFVKNHTIQGINTQVPSITPPVLQEIRPFSIPEQIAGDVARISGQTSGMHLTGGRRRG